MISSQLKYLFLSLTCVGLVACSVKTYDKSTDTGTMSEAESLRDRGFYEEARHQYSRIKTEFPQSPLQVEAALKTALSYYEEESYGAAASAYQDFIKTYPGRPEIPDALYSLGMSYVKQMPSTPQRDTRPTVQAIDTFTRLMIDYPDNAHKDEVNKLIVEARDQLATKIYEIARFYEKRKDYNAAARRYEELAEEFSDNGRAEEAAAKQVYCLKKAGDAEKAEKLQQLFEEKFPNSKFSSMMSP